MTKQVADVLDERGVEPRAAKLIAHEINNSIEGMVPKAKKVRDFLEGLADKVRREGLTSSLDDAARFACHEPLSRAEDQDHLGFAWGGAAGV